MKTPTAALPNGFKWKLHLVTGGFVWAPTDDKGQVMNRPYDTSWYAETPVIHAASTLGPQGHIHRQMWLADRPIHK